MLQIASNLYTDVFKDNKSWYCKNGDDLTDDEAKVLANGIKENQKLETLAIICFDPKDRGLSINGGEVILKAIKNHRSIITLSLQGNMRLGDQVAFAVQEMLKNHHSLRFLDLTNCGISDKGAITIAKGLKQNNKLEILNIYHGNSITHIKKYSSENSDDDDSLNIGINVQGQIQLELAAFERGKNDPKLIIQ